MLQERSIAEKMDRQLTHRSAARSVTALGAMLAHEIKNPLSGIRGAAQLLEASVSDDDRALTRLICDETDRIVKLVDRMEAFSDERPSRAREPQHPRGARPREAARPGRFRAPHPRSSRSTIRRCRMCSASRDQLIQVFLNLVKNAAEAIGDESIDGEIAAHHRLSARRAAARPRQAPSRSRLPLEFCIRDNGPGIPPTSAAESVRSVRDHQAYGLWPGSCTGRQDRSATTAASSNAKSIRGEPCSACSCR